MKKVVVGFISAAALATVSMAMAGGMTVMPAPEEMNMPVPEECSDNELAGFVVSGNLGYGKVDYNASSLGITSARLSGFAWNASLGYQFNPYIALESGFTGFHEIVLSPGQIDTSGVDLLAKVILPFKEKYALFVKGGVMNSFTKTMSGGVTTNVSRVVPEVGIGASYYVNSKLALTLQGIATLRMNGPSDATFTMPPTYTGYAGVSYKFNDYND